MRPAADTERPEQRLPGEQAGGASQQGLSRAQAAGAYPISPTRLVGDVVVELGLTTRERVEEAVELARAQGKPTGQVLVEQGILRHDQLARVVAERFELDYIDLSIHELDMNAVHLLDLDTIRRCQAIPVGFLDDGTLLLAMADPTNVLAVDDVAMITGRRVRPASASVEDVNILITRLSHADHAIEQDPEAHDVAVEVLAETESLIGQTGDEAPAASLVRSLIADAVKQRASDIHIDPGGEHGIRVLLRIDGALTQAGTLEGDLAGEVISSLKIMAGMEMDELGAPREGRLALVVEGRRVDVLVVALPLVHGEAVFLRILDKHASVKSLESLGMQRTEHDRFAYAIRRGGGAVLVTGPTGAGSSTTLYAALDAINDGARSIFTIEDPVESRIPGIKQMQVAPQAGITYASGLRSILRADPQAIMVGELLDRDTAQIALEAALTGHLVLSTLHTRDAPSALGRLMDMGVERFLVSCAIDCIVAQRLVRLLCPHCKQPSKAPESLLAEYGLYGSEAFDALGCDRCAGSGYRGRIGIYEVMSIGNEIRELVLARASVEDITAAATRQGMRRLREDGIAKVRAAQTSIAEVERITTSVL